MTSTTPTIGTVQTFATGTNPSVNSTSPDAITVANGYVWVAYHDNANSYRPKWHQNRSHVEKSAPLFVRIEVRVERI